MRFNSKFNIYAVDNFYFSSQKAALEYVQNEYKVYRLVKTRNNATALDSSNNVLAKVTKQKVWGL